MARKKPFVIRAELEPSKRRHMLDPFAIGTELFATSKKEAKEHFDVFLRKTTKRKPTKIIFY